MPSDNKVYIMDKPMTVKRMSIDPRDMRSSNSGLIMSVGRTTPRDKISHLAPTPTAEKKGRESWYLKS